MKENSNNSIKRYEPSIENFICDKFSICREERQYAVFLYNILRKYSTPVSRKEKDKKVEEIFKACGLEDAVVDHVFYEAAFMRDFYERNRRLRYSKEEDWEAKLLNKKFTANEENFDIERFNKRLIEYTYKQMCDEQKKEEKIIKIDFFEKESNLGHNDIEFEKITINNGELDDSDKNWIKYRIKWMMNVQPDIAVVYHIGQEDVTQKFLLFIECKFLSKESAYPYNEEKIKQRQAQWMVADFLSKSGYLGNGIEIADCMKRDKNSRLVRFVRRGETKVVKEEEGEILIEELIKFDKDIFKLD